MSAKIIEIAGKHFEPILFEEEILARTDVVALDILERHGGEPLHLAHIAMGAVFWAVDLSRALRRQDPGVRITHDLVRISTYGMGVKSSGAVRILADLAHPVAGKHVVAVDEVVETGLTLNTFISGLNHGVEDDHGKRSYPKTVEVAVLTDKRRTVNGEVYSVGNVPIEYVGFNISNDDFIIGRGLDYKEEGRELPHIYRAVD